MADVNPFAQFAPQPAGSASSEPANPFARFAPAPAQDENPFARFAPQPAANANDFSPAATAEKVAKYESENPFWTRLGQRFSKGTLELQQGLAGTVGAQLQGQSSAMQDVLDAIDKGLSFDEALAKAPDKNLFQPAELEAMRGYAESPMQARGQIRNTLNAQFGQAAAPLADLQQRIDKIPSSPALEALGANIAKKDYASAAKILMQNPLSTMGQFGVESLPQVLPAIAAGAVGGPSAAAGVLGATAGFQDFGQSVVDFLGTKGIDTKDPQALAKAFADPALMAEAKSFAAKRFGPNAAGNALAGATGGLSLVPEKLMQSAIGKELLNVLGLQPLSQAAIGGGTEAAAQVASTGGISDPSAVALNAIGEFAGAPVEALGLGAGRIAKLVSPDVGAPASEATIARILSGDPTNEVVPPITRPAGAEAAPGTEGTSVSGAAAVGAGGEIPIAEPAKSGLGTSTSATPERLVSAAIKVGDKVYEGTDHGQAFEKAMAAGETPDAISRGDHGGFVTSTGRYVTRQEATAIAEAAKQPARVKEGSVTSQGTTTPSAEEVTAAKTPEEKAAVFAKYGLDVNGQPLAKPTQDNAAPVAMQQGFNSPPVNIIPGEQPRQLYLIPKSVKAAERDLAGGGELYSLSPHPVNGQYSVRQDTGIKPLVVEDDDTWAQLQRAVDSIEQANPGHSRGDLLQAVVKHLGFNAIEFAPNDVVNTSQLREAFGTGGPKLVVFDTAPKAFHVEFSQDALAKPLPFSHMGVNNIQPTDSRVQMMLPGYDARAHKPNTVVVHGEPVEGFAEINKLLPFLKEMQRKFFNGAKVVLSFTNEGPLAKGAARGRFFALKDGTIVIWLRRNLGGFQSVNTLMHEAGHATAFWNLWNTDAPTQQAIIADYAQYLSRSGKVPPEQAMAEVMNPSVLATLAQDVDENERAIVSGESVDSNATRMKKWFDFDEWMAEQFARWMTSDRKPFTIVEKWFANVAAKIKAIYRLFGFNPEKSTATAVMTEWLRSVQERNERVDPSNTPTAILHSQLEGKAQVQDELDEDWGEDGPGLSMASFGLRKLATHAGLTKAHPAAVDKYNWWIGKMWGLLQIAAKNPHIVGLQRYVEAVRGFHISKMALVSRADFRIREWRKLGKDMAGRLSNFLFDLDSLSYLKPGENMRWPTNAELIALARQHGLNAEAVALYTKIKGDFADVLDKMQAAWVRDAQQSISDPQQLWTALQSITQEMAAMRAKPYFPHERFGNWTVVMRDHNRKVLFYQQFSKQRDAEQSALTLQKSHPGMKVSTGYLPQEVAQFRGLPPALVKSLANRINLTQEQRNQLNNLIFDLSPANSAVKRFKRRKNTPGYSLDGMRAYAQYFLTMSGHLARLQYSGIMQEAIKEVDATATAMEGVYAGRAVKRRRGIAEWMQRNFDYINSSKSEWQGLRSFAFLWYLGYNISSAMVNLMQVPMVALPYLSARFGDLSTMNELRRAYSDIRGTYMMRPGALKPEVQDALNEAVRQGFVDESMAAELASAASGGTLESMLPGTKIQRGLMNFANIGAIPFQMVEKLNRRVVFLSAFRMAQKAGANPRYLAELRAANPQLFAELQGRGWTAQNALAFLAGRDAVERSQFEYAKWARPEFMRGKKAVLFTFFMFKQNMLWFLKNSPGAARAWIMLLAGAGVMGLPGADHLDELIKFLAFHIGGKHFDPEQELRKFVQSFDVDPDLVSHGLGFHSLGLTAIGDALGIPVPDVDLSSRIGMQQVIPGVQPMLALNDDSWDERFGKSAQEVLGAGVNIPLAMLKAVATHDPDTFKQIERGLPTAWKNLARAYRWIANGGETNASGAMVEPFDIMDSKGRLAIAAQALGFTPSSLAAKRELSTAQYEAMTYWTLRRGELFDQFFFAREANDREALENAKEAVRAFNQAAPNSKLKITREELLASFKSRKRNNRKVELGSPGNASQGMTPLLKQLQSLYPSAGAGTGGATLPAQVPPQ